MERPYILHMFTPGAQMSPFDVNMAADAGYQVITPYCGVTLEQVTGLTQDAIFSRGPKGVARTGIFIGGRDVLLAADMLERARAALVPPFQVSLFADPSGSYTTAAALVAATEAALRRHHGLALRGLRVLLLGGTGTVGRIAGVLCAREGATAVLSSHKGLAAAQAAAGQTGARFGVTLEAVSGHTDAERRAAIAEADVVMGVAAAGVQVMTAADRAIAARLRVAADVNAVPPEGLAGVGVMDDGRPLEGTAAVGLGALAIGNVKYQVQHRLLVRMREAKPAVCFGFDDAFAVAREVLAGPAGGAGG
ncbi:NAD(P)-dependent methylenetetrahydromethanopterin dehydrogenase [Piscinibacter sakaiensis]|uniref:Methylene tetrahydromethanopterin dehydrogenase n=1 Tax=Piscinibacter sakaiensis TaxID=1547922 RepID=A0A0K8P4Z4_PISS1|nr:NAD(P)-dependent methylenetetrahydromethanopterin dehydrogenase [Piscinibacter sakaiensis]GAP37712.1 methylene tetrahydromethanopterin dehydrogenase [Piscinibacter sakaiensis]